MVFMEEASSGYKVGELCPASSRDALRALRVRLRYLTTGFTAYNSRILRTIIEMKLFIGVE